MRHLCFFFEKNSNIAEIIISELIRIFSDIDIYHEMTNEYQNQM